MPASAKMSPMASSAAAEVRGARSSRRHVLVLVGAGIAVAVAVGVLIGKAASYARLAHELAHASGGWLGFCLLGEVLAYTGYVIALRQTAAVDGGPQLSTGAALRLVAASFGAMALATGIGSFAVQIWALRRRGASARDALSRVLALNTLNWGVLAGAACAAAAVLLAGVDGGAPPGIELPWLAIVPACVAAALWVTGQRRYARLAAEEGGRVRLLLAAAIRGVRLVRLLPPRAFGGSALYWAGDVLCMWGGLRAFGVELGLAALVLAYATGYLVAGLPLPLGGAGGVDAAMTYALTAVGVPLSSALLATFAYRFFNFWLPVLPALAVLPSIRRAARSA